VVTIENATSAGETITLDEKHFVNCHLKNCTLFYSGGDFLLTNTTLENCPVNLSGPAQRTVALLLTMGVLKPGAVPGIPSVPGNPRAPVQ
jgi:hypothetical protein